MSDNYERLDALSTEQLQELIREASNTGLDICEDYQTAHDILAERRCEQAAIKFEKLLFEMERK